MTQTAEEGNERRVARRPTSRRIPPRQVALVVHANDVIVHRFLQNLERDDQSASTRATLAVLVPAGVDPALPSDPLTDVLDQSDQTVRRAHHSIVDVLEILCSAGRRDRVGPQHHLGCRQYEDALSILVELDAHNAADNRDR